MNSHLPRKHFGQHFLTELSIIDQIVAVIAPKKNDPMVEIGPGLGALTEALLPYLKQLHVIEIDRDLAAQLRANMPANVIVHEADVLKFNIGGLSPQGTVPNFLARDVLSPQGTVPIRIVGNLPYNISTPLLFHLFKFIDHIGDMHFMLQREVADRLAAKVGTKDYGRLTVMSQYFCQIEKILEVPPEAFEPRPKVHSAFIRLIPHKKYFVKDFNLFEKVVREAFSYRRKTLKNALKNIISVEQLKFLNIDIDKRPEEITLEEFIKISRDRS